MPKVNAIDTLGAGDFFHGAFAKAMAGKELTMGNFILALEAASHIAALSVQSLGTRKWLEDA